MLNFILERIAFLQGKSYKGPNAIFIETHSACTNNCFMCPRHSKVAVRKPMSLETYKAIISELQKIDYSGELHLYGQCEPFLDKSIIQKIHYAHEKLPHAKIVMISNFTVLTTDLMDEILKAPIHNFSCSTYAMSEEDYIKICGKNNFKKSFTNQIKFLKKFALTQPFSFANYIIENKYNEHDIDFIEHYLFNIVPASFIQKGKNCQLFNSSNNTLPLSNKFYAPCLYNDMKITSDGVISTCPCDNNNLLKIGTLSEINTTITDYNNNNNARKLRKRMRKQISQDNYCQYCEFARNKTNLEYFLGIENSSSDNIYNHKIRSYKNSATEINIKLQLFNQIFKDGDEANWTNCLNELRRKFYTKEL